MTCPPPAILLLINVGLNGWILDSCKRFENCLKNNFCTFTRNGHANLFSHAFLATHEDIIIGEGLESCSFSICKCSWFLPVIDMSSAAAASCNSVGRFIGIKSFVNLANSRPFDVELLIIR